MILVLQPSSQDNPIQVANEFKRLLFLQGRDALALRNAIRSGEVPEDMQININDLPPERIKEGYLKADLPFDELRSKMIEMLDHGVGFVFLDASENEYEAALRRFVDHSFRYDQVIYFASYEGEGMTLSEGMPKDAQPTSAKEYEEVYPEVFGDIVGEEKPVAEQTEDEVAPRPHVDEAKKAQETLNPWRKLTGRELKNLWINIGFACFFSFLCFLLPIVTLSKESTSEALLIISVVIGFAFVLFSNFPLVSYQRAAKKEGKLSWKAILIHYGVHQLFAAGLAIGLVIMIKKNGYANLGYAYVAFIAASPLLSILYCLLFGGIFFKAKKENK